MPANGQGLPQRAAVDRRAASGYKPACGEGTSPVFVDIQFLRVLSFIVNRAAITKRGMQLHTAVIGDVVAEQAGQLLLACDDAAIPNPHPNGPKVLAVPHLWGRVVVEMQLERDVKECGEEEA